MKFNHGRQKDKDIMKIEDDYFCVDLLPQKKDLLRVSLKPAPKRKLGRSQSKQGTRSNHSGSELKNSKPESREKMQRKYSSRPPS